MTIIADAWASVVAYWSANQGALILGVGSTSLVGVLIVLWRFIRTRQRSKVISTFAAIVVMAWTSEGLLHVGLAKFHLPTAFAVMTFFVFEAMMVASALKAEEHRNTKGVPGPAGQYVFVLAAASGIVAAFGAHNAGEVLLRVVLPPLAVGQWWIFLVDERATDTDDMRARRAATAADRQATWAVTPRSLLVRIGVMKPGTITVT